MKMKALHGLKLLVHTKYNLKTRIVIYKLQFLLKPISVAARFKTWVCGRSLAGSEGWDPGEGWVIRLLCVLYVVRSLRRADPSSREVLPRVCVFERDLNNKHHIYSD